MRAITIGQPRASLLAAGVLRVINTRVGVHRGLHGQVVALHASSAPHDPLGPCLDAAAEAEARAMGWSLATLPRGAVVGVAKVIAVAAPEVVARACPELRDQCGGPSCTVLWGAAAFASPVPAAGRAGVWLLPREAEEMVSARLRALREEMAGAGGGRRVR